MAKLNTASSTIGSIAPIIIRGTGCTSINGRVYYLLLQIERIAFRLVAQFVGVLVIVEAALDGEVEICRNDVGGLDPNLENEVKAGKLQNLNKYLLAKSTTILKSESKTLLSRERPLAHFKTKPIGTATLTF